MTSHARPTAVGPANGGATPESRLRVATVRSALTIDLEEYFQVSNFEGVIERESWDSLPSRVVGETEQLLELFEQQGVRATFFVLGWVAERQPALIRAIAARGHELACHGYAHELVYRIGPRRFREDLRRARERIEHAAGVRVVGYRAPSYSITNDSLWALEILAEEGFEYDSSIFPIRHHRYGIPEFCRAPVRMELPSGARLAEFPLTTLDLGPLRLPLAGGAYLRFMPPALFRWGVRRLIEAGEPTVLYLHPWEIDAGQPRQKVSWRVRVNHYHHLDRMLGRVRALIEAHAFAPMGDVLLELEQGGRLPLSSPFAEPIAAAG
jgi:polysaccharide deacetylase family protein (PEP-CTERM system associated)